MLTSADGQTITTRTIAFYPDFLQMPRMRTTGSSKTVTTRRPSSALYREQVITATETSRIASTIFSTNCITNQWLFPLHSDRAFSSPAWSERRFSIIFNAS